MFILLFFYVVPQVSCDLQNCYRSVFSSA